jgi:2-dehydro-3-deoxygluconokinase
MVSTAVVLGEVLVELSSTEPLAAGAATRLGFSGDALNAAAAAAAAGARTVLVARIPDDELGDALVEHIGALGVDTGGVRRVPGQHGVYFSHADPDGRRQFTYVRRGSAGSGLEPADLDPDLLRDAVVLSSGITWAVGADAAVRRAAELAGAFVYDPNYRPRLISAAGAGAALRAVLRHAALVTPSWPEELGELLGATPTDQSCVETSAPAPISPHDRDPAAAVVALQALGATDVALTCGADGVLLTRPGGLLRIAAAPPPRVVDQTGAGDSFAGTVVGRLAAGDDLETAVRLGVAAAALSVQGQGGTGFVPTLDQTRAHAAVGANQP